MLRRALATAAVSAIAVVGLAPAANAQGVNDIIANFNCDLLEQGLNAVGLVNEDTTRNELAAKLRDESRNILDIPFVTNIYAGQIADRALECGIVKADPQNLFSGSAEFLEMFGSLSSTLVAR